MDKNLQVLIKSLPKDKLSSDNYELVESNLPNIDENEVLIKTEYSLISSGTERMLVDFGKGNILEKAKQQPDKLKEVINKAKTDGIFSTVDAVRNKLNEQ